MNCFQKLFIFAVETTQSPQIIDSQQVKSCFRIKKSDIKKPDFLVYTQVFISKQLQLLTWSVCRFSFFVVENFHAPELLVCDAHDSNFAVFW